MKMVMLGSGTSTGVPRIGNDWGQCDPTMHASIVEGLEFDDGRIAELSGEDVSETLSQAQCTSA